MVLTPAKATNTVLMVLPQILLDLVFGGSADVIDKGRLMKC